MNIESDIRDDCLCKTDAGGGCVEPGRAGEDIKTTGSLLRGAARRVTSVGQTIDALEADVSGVDACGTARRVTFDRHTTGALEAGVLDVDADAEASFFAR